MATTVCPACGANAFASEGDGGTCARCGYASGEANRCPHCGVVSGVEGAGEKAICPHCGGPRIPSNLGGEAAADALRQQKKALANARAASLATVLQALFAAVVTLIGLGVGPASIVGKVILFALAAAPLILAMRSRSQATRAREAAREAGTRAWRTAAEDAVTRSSSGVTVEGLAKMLGVDPARADALLTELAVHERARIDVGDDAEVRYSAAPGPRVGELETSEAPLSDEEAERGRAGRSERSERSR